MSSSTFKRWIGLSAVMAAGLAALPAAAYAPCERWSVERLRLGMRMDEVREMRYAPKKKAPTTGTQGVRLGVSASGAWKVPIRDPRGEWKGRVSLKNDVVSRVRVVFERVDAETVLGRILQAIDEERPASGDWVFRSEACNTILTVEPHGKRGARVTLRPLYGIDTSRP